MAAQSRTGFARFFPLAQSARLEEGFTIRKKKIRVRYLTGAGEKINANNWMIP